MNKQKEEIFDNNEYKYEEMKRNNAGNILELSNDITNKYIPSFEYDKTLNGHSKNIFCILCAYLNDRDEEDLIVVSGSEDATVKIFDIEKGECKFTTIKHENNENNWITGISISKINNNIKLIGAVAIKSNKINLYNTINNNERNKNEINPIKTIENNNCDGIIAISFVSNNEKILILDAKKENNYYNFHVKLYDTGTSNLISTMKSIHQSNVSYANNNHIIPSHNNNLSISSICYNNNIIKINDLRSNELIHNIQNNNKNHLWDIKLISNDNYIISTSNNKLNIFNYYNNQLIHSITNNNNNNDFYCISVSPYSQYIASFHQEALFSAKSYLKIFTF